MYLGIDANTEIIYGGSGIYGAHILAQQPILAPAKFQYEQDSKICPENSSGSAEFLFREDAFDPVTRVRRGRFYKKMSIQPQEWTVMLSPPFVADSMLSKQRVYTYQSCGQTDLMIRSDARQQLAVLGTTDAFSLWMIINKEVTYTKEILVTLKARQSFGVLPEIDWASVPGDVGLLKDKVESLLDDIYRAGAESIVDRAREAATAILSAYLQNVGVKEASGRDLGALINLLEKQNDKNVQRIVRCAAEITQRLHSRGKHAEQEKRDGLRPICQQDAELAVQCIGVMLCDLSWGRWT